MRLTASTRPCLPWILRIPVLRLYFAALLASEGGVFHQFAIVQAFGSNHGHDFVAHPCHFLEGFTARTGHEHVRYVFRTCWHGEGTTVRQCRTQCVDTMPETAQAK